MIMGMAVWDTEENDRTWMTEETLFSLARTVDWDKHRLIISDNGSCEETLELYREIEDELPFEVLYNGENLGTANAINRVWRDRRAGEHALKIDNDVVIFQSGWADWLEDVFQRDPSIGICGLKRKDLAECPWSKEEWSRSTIRMLPHKAGQPWIVVEEVVHVLGTCQAYNSAFLEKIGYLTQPGLYGFDDSLAACRAIAAGFKSVFLCGFEIDHIDPGGTEYSEWKRQAAAGDMAAFNQLKREYLSGEREVYYNGGF